MRVEVEFHDITIRELEEFAKHAREVIVDGDRRKVIFIDPDDWLIEELSGRGYEVRG